MRSGRRRRPPCDPDPGRSALGSWIRPGSASATPIASGVARRHPVLDLGAEEVERQGAWRLVRVDVLTIALAALDEELAAGPERDASSQDDRHGLVDHTARE